MKKKINKEDGGLKISRYNNKEKKKQQKKYQYKDASTHNK